MAETWFSRYLIHVDHSASQLLKIGWKHFYGIYVLLLVFDEHVTLYMSNFDVKLVFQRLSSSLKLQQVQKLLETAGPTSNLQMNN